MSNQQQDLPWPRIKPKKGLRLTEVLPSQIYYIDDFLSYQECSQLLEFSKALDMTPPRAPGRGEATRTNFRFEHYSPTFANQLSQILFPYISQLLTFHSSHASKPPTGLFPKIRIYHYPPSAFFGPHYDDYLHDELTGFTSEWTVLIYLTGEPDVVGGGTVFHLPSTGGGGKKKEKRNEKQLLKVGLKAGRMVLHKHGEDCLLHEGERVGNGGGGKWVVRSDVMYER